MIGVLMRIARLSLRRDRVAQILSFLVPIGFFSIFAVIFGQSPGSGTPRLEVVVVDEDRSEVSARLVLMLERDATLAVRDSLRPSRDVTVVPATRDEAERRVREGDVPVALVIPAGWGAAIEGLVDGGARLLLLHDPADPISRPMTFGALQRAGARALGLGTGEAAEDEPMLIPADVRDVAGDHRQGRRMVAFYAAGIVVMFLLFSASAGGGALLDEQEAGTLERVLGARGGIGTLLAAKWLHLTLVGVTQVVAMFVWAWLVFELELPGHLPGFAIMTVVTAAAAAAFGLVLATLCASRPQLSGITTLVVLTMSALGGSMFPRVLMSESMRNIGLATFNAWAIDGYLNVFWRELPLVSLAPQVGVLAGMTVAFLALARLFARRWETV
jgi:ABC-2 type transport system permease protein